MKMGKNMIIVLAVVALLVFFMPSISKEVKKEAGPGGAIITRTVTPASVNPSGIFTIRYTFSGVTANYGGILQETIPTGFTINAASFVNNMDVFSKKVTGQLVEMPFTGSLNNQYFEFTVTAGSSSGILNNGFVEWGAGAGIETLPSYMLTVCIAQSYSACFSGDRYWYDSCDVIGTIRQDCGSDSCDPFGADYCNGLIIQHDANCYTVGCASDACTSTPYVNTETVQTCVWQCSGGVCQQNSGADTDYNGLVSNQELLDYITLWIANSVTNQQLLDGITAWISS